jgi:5-methylcytosine-specific restriction endonuclease McrA
MGRALVLNATYEPIGVVSARRAVVLALGDKVDVVTDTGAVVVSQRLSVSVPSVVRLRYYVKVPYRRVAPLNRRALFARDHGRCQYCAGPADSIDHVVPRSRGGVHAWDNVVAACRRCNTIKGDRLLSETSLRLRSWPSPPDGPVWVQLVVGAVPDDWAPFLTRRAA